MSKHESPEDILSLVRTAIRVTLDKELTEMPSLQRQRQSQHDHRARLRVAKDLISFEGSQASLL